MVMWPQKNALALFCCYPQSELCFHDNSDLHLWYLDLHLWQPNVIFCHHINSFETIPLQKKRCFFSISMPSRRIPSFGNSGQHLKHKFTVKKGSNNKMYRPQVKAFVAYVISIWQMKSLDTTWDNVNTREPINVFGKPCHISSAFSTKL